jgi:large subunit ribosomal protein L21
MFAVIKTGGKQYLVRAGDKIKIEKLTPQKGKVVFKEILLISDKDEKEVKIGDPFLKGATVEGNILKQGRFKKVTIIKQIPKKRHRVKRGHHQLFTEVEIKKIVA